MTAIERLAQWASTLRAGDIPPAVRRRAVGHGIDTLGVALAGSATPVGGMARAVALLAASTGAATLLGSGSRIGAQAAAFANGVAAHALDFDDNCYAGVVHGSAVVLPAALAMAEQVDATGAELLTAFIAGSECEYAVGAATRNVLYEKGWWTTGVLGPIGAAVATGRLLGLDAVAMASALGLAVAGTGGAKSCFGTDGKPLLAGRAAEAGVVCAWLAAQGASGPVEAFESPKGFAALFNAGAFDAGALDQLGLRWSFDAPGVDVKRIPVCLSSHAAVDAVLALVREHGLAPADIERIVCDVPPMVVGNLVYDRPQSVQQSQFSMPFAVAMSLLHGTLGLHHLQAHWLVDDAVCAMMARVEMRTGAMWDAVARTTAPEGAQVELHLNDGRCLRSFRAQARGCVADPLTQQELQAKFVACALRVMSDGHACALFERLHELDSDLPARSLLRPEPTMKKPPAGG